MTDWSTCIVLALALTLSCTDARAQAQAKQHFGSVAGASAAPIAWELAAGAELTAAGLRLTRAGASARSSELQLTSLQLYRVSATMARGPFCVPRFVISYLDAHGQAHTWAPLWQFPNAARAEGQPLSPHAQRYLQGLVLPEGASHARVQLELVGPSDPKLARFSRWELLDLRFEPVRSVRCCERQGADRLLGGDLESAQTALPAGWTQWGLDGNNALERVALANDPAHDHVLRAKPHTIAVLASTTPIAVTPGSAWRISAQVRGQGTLELFAISLNDDRPVPVRVGNDAGRARFETHAGAWTTFSTTWFAEAPNVAAAQVVAVLAAETSLEIDNLQLRPFE